MKRRDLIQNISAMTLLSSLLLSSKSSGQETIKEKKCDLNTDDEIDLVGYSQGFFEIRHQHQFVIPLRVLIDPPNEGYSARSSLPLVGKTDFDGLKNRTDSMGRPLDLRVHAHTVSLTKDDLILLSKGKFVLIDLPKFGHKFYFVANDNTLNRIKS